MSEINTYQFPQTRLDEMSADAARFAESRFDVASMEKPLWRFDVGYGNGRCDAAESWYLARQLEFMRKGVMETSFPDLQATSLFPTNTEIDNASTSYTVQQSKPVGTSLVTQNMAGIIPMVDESIGETNYKIFQLMAGYGYSIQEARTAMKIGKPLPARRAVLCRQQLMRDLEQIAFNGHAATGLKGALTLAGTATYTVPADGVGGSKKLKDKDPDKVLRDLNALAKQVVTDTKGIEIPNVLLLPMSVYEHIAAVRVGDGTSMSILNYFRDNNAHITRIARTYQSETAGAGSTTRTMAYEQSPEKLEFVVPVPFEQFAPGTDETGLFVKTVCQIRTAGMVSHRPKSQIYADDF